MKVLLIENNDSIIGMVNAAFAFSWPDVELITRSTAANILKWIKQEQPDAIILDLNIPDVNGFNLLREIREYSSVSIITLSKDKDNQDMLKSLEYGADDHITKPFDYLTLLARVKSVLRRVHSIPFKGRHDNIMNGRLSIDFVNQRVKVDNKAIRLTQLEYRILSLLIRNKNEVVSNKEIVEEIWGQNYVRSADNNLRICIKRLRNKLKDDPPSMIVNKRGSGYMFKS